MVCSEVYVWWQERGGRNSSEEYIVIRHTESFSVDIKHGPWSDLGETVARCETHKRWCECENCHIGRGELNGTFHLHPGYV